MPSTLRFLRQFLSSREGAVVREESTYRRGDETLPASLYRPASRRGLLPGWVALHGLTYRGREHESLDGFARALAASGTAVLVPEIPEWRALRIAPGATGRTIEAAVLELDARPFIAPGRVGVIGFSFGGTHALVASTEPALRGHLAAIVSWGGYADLGRTLRFAFTGEHELDGEAHHTEPDPYGRWILAGNYLTDVPGHQGDRAVADALLWLAREVGRRKIMAWEPATDPLKLEARARLEPDDRALFDDLAPPADQPTAGRERRTSIGRAMRDAAAGRSDLLVDPAPYLGRVPVPVFLAHGRDDRLVPWTELPRLRRALPDGQVAHALVTSLFAHSFRERRFPTPAMVVEGLRFVRALTRMIHLV